MKAVQGFNMINSKLLLSTVLALYLIGPAVVLGFALDLSKDQLQLRHGIDTKQCKCLFGQPCWPSTEAFKTLASQLSTPSALLQPILPPAAPCYHPDGTNAGSDPSPECLDAQENAKNPIWRSNHPGAQQNINFEKYIFRSNSTISACYTNTSLPEATSCGQGSVPPLGVNASTVGDVQAAVRFAKEHNLRVVVKTTGHDYMGRSAGRGGFLIWTHHLREGEGFESEFRLEGAPEGSEPFQAITLGSGAQWGDAYKLAGDNGRYVVGGISPNHTVGAAGGWIQGGGHSVFAPKHGLGVDNVLQFKLVLADGTHVTANQYTHSDLFWALRGGGGGSWGVLTSVTYQTHDPFPFTLSFMATSFSALSNATDPAATPNPAALEAVTELIKLQPLLSDKSWGGYSWFSNDFLIAAYFAPDTSVEETNSTLSSSLDAVRRAVNDTDGSKVVYFAVPFESWDAFIKMEGLGGAGQDPTGGIGPGDPASVGNNVELASRLIPKSITEEDPERVASVLLGLNNVVGFNSVAGGAVSRPDPDSMALHPGWRKAVTHAWIAASWEDGDDVATIDAAVEGFKRETQVMDQITTDSASYLNEGSRHEVDFKKTYWGPHYGRLRDIKGKYDPTSLFVVRSGIASDEWDEDLTCRRS